MDIESTLGSNQLSVTGNNLYWNFKWKVHVSKIN